MRTCYSAQGTLLNALCLCAACEPCCMLSCFSCVRLGNPMDRGPPSSSANEIFPGKNTEVGCHFLLQGIFSTEGSKLCFLCLLHWEASSLPLSSVQSLSRV